MRIKRLNLMRYGHFEDRMLEFPDTGLTIVYGPNETGKSTSLSAIADLLYGFGHLTPYDFRFDTKQLRIGATLLSRDGEELTCVRRKGNKDTVLDESDTPLPDSALAPFLGRSTRDFFEQTFGLSHDRLRRGGDAIASAEGDLGKILFEAGSGISDLAEIQAALDEEADGIFAARKSGSRVLFQSMDAFDAASKALKAASIKRQDWIGAERELAEATQALDSVRGTIRELQAKRSRLNRWQRVLPILRELESLRTDLDRHGEIINVPVDARDYLIRALQQRRIEEDLLSGETVRLAEVTEQLDECVVDTQLLEAQDTIAGQFQRIAGIEEHMAALPVLKSESQDLEKRILARAEQLDLPMADGRPLIPGHADVARLTELATEKQTLDAAGKKALADEAEVAAQLTDLRQELETLGDVDDPKGDLAILQRLRTVVATLDDGRKSQRTLRQLEKKIAAQMTGLPWWTGSAEELVAAVLPTPAQIDAHRKAVERSEKDLEATGEKLEAARAALGAARHKLADYREREAFFTDEDLANAREQRQSAWRSVRQVLDGESRPGTTQPPHPAEAGATLGPDYELLVTKADDIADSRIDSVEKVVEHKRLQQDVALHEYGVAALDTKTRQATEAHEARLAEWRALWQPLDISPLSPVEMREGLTVVEAVRETSVSRDELTEEVADLESRAAAALQQLRSLAARLETPAIRDAGANAADADADMLIVHLETTLNRHLELFNAAREIRTRIGEQQKTRTKHQHDIRDLDTRVSDWKTQWNRCCDRLKLKPELSVAQAAAVVSAWEELARMVAGLDRTQAQLAKSQAILEDFVSSVNTLADSLRPDARVDQPRPATALVRELHTDCLEMQSATTRRRELGKQRDQHKENLDRHEAAILKASAEIRTLMELAHATSEDDLNDNISRAEKQREVAGNIDKAQQRLIEAGDGESEEALRSQSAEVAPDTIAAELADLAVELDALDRAREEATRSEEQARVALDALRSKTGADQHAQALQVAVSKMSIQARDYLRLKTASILLRHGVDRIRDRHKNPVMTKASGYFAALTDGSFGALGTDFDNKDNPTIVGIRSGGERVYVSEMSDGTRDQLYLSLRIAFVEQYCATEEPLPFIGDDLFVHFDDERTAAGLKLLASLPHTQTILFTHHHHLLPLAENLLGDRVELVNLLELANLTAP